METRRDLTIRVLTEKNALSTAPHRTLLPSRVGRNSRLENAPIGRKSCKLGNARIGTIAKISSSERKPASQLLSTAATVKKCAAERIATPQMVCRRIIGLE